MGYSNKNKKASSERMKKMNEARYGRSGSPQITTQTASVTLSSTTVTTTLAGTTTCMTSTRTPPLMTESIKSLLTFTPKGKSLCKLEKNIDVSQAGPSGVISPISAALFAPSTSGEFHERFQDDSAAPFEVLDPSVSPSPDEPRCEQAKRVLLFDAIQEALDTTTLSDTSLIPLSDVSSSSEEEEAEVEDYVVDYSKDIYEGKETFPTSYSNLQDLYQKIQDFSSEDEHEDLEQQNVQETHRTFAGNRYEVMKELQDLGNLGTERNTILVEISQLERLIKEILVCKECLSSKINLTVDDNKTHRLVNKIVIKCRNCKEKNEVMTSKMSESPSKITTSKQCRKLHLKYVQGVLGSGIQFSQSQIFVAELGIEPISSRQFSRYTKDFASLMEQKVDCMKDIAAKAAKNAAHLLGEALLDDAVNIAVTFDGTWQKRGRSSLYGISFVIDVNTGLVLDYVICSKFCQMCVKNNRKMEKERFRQWHVEHLKKNECSITFDINKSSGAMESEGAVTLFRRSLERGLRYTTMISDQDSSTYKRLSEENVYGDKYPIRKSHCLNHIAKSIYRKIDKVRKEKGRLTQKSGNAFANFYRVAIKKHFGNNNKIRKRIMASILHHASTDDRPMHKLCSTKYCKYKVDKKEGRVGEGWHSDLHNMPHTLHPDAAAEMFKIMKEATSDRVLNQVSNMSQNINESLHSKVWSFHPKETFTGLARLKYAVARTVLEHNCGIASCDLSTQLNLGVNSPLKNIVEKRTKRTLQKSIPPVSKRRKKIKHDEKDYEPGAF